MKKILLFLFLITFIICPPSDSVKEEMMRRRKEKDEKIKECILKSSMASDYIKNLIKENKDENVMKKFHHRNKDISENDHKVIKQCRFQMIESLRQQRRLQKEKVNSNQNKEEKEYDSL